VRASATPDKDAPRGEKPAPPEAVAGHKRGVALNETVPPHVEATAATEEGAEAAKHIVLLYDSEWTRPVLHLRVTDEQCVARSACSACSASLATLGLRLNSRVPRHAAATSPDTTKSR
jgi:hypothetical protein